MKPAVRRTSSPGSTSEPGPGLLRADVGADQARPELGGHLRELRVPAAPAVVDQVGARGAGLAGDLVPVGVRADHDVGVGTAHGRDEAGRPPDFLARVHVRARSGRHPADVDDVGALGDDLVHPVHGCGLVPGHAGPVEGVRRPVHDRHDQQLPRPEAAVPQAQAGLLPGRAGPARAARAGRVIASHQPVVARARPSAGPVPRTAVPPRVLHTSHTAPAHAGVVVLRAAEPAR